MSYTLIIYAQNVYYLYVSRFLMGFAGGALYVVIPLMTAEIAEDRYVWRSSAKKTLESHETRQFDIIRK